jgi:hypothetical protein
MSEQILEKMEVHSTRLTAIEVNMSSIKDNLALHMMRTDQNEKMIRDLQKFKWLAIGAISMVSFLTTIAVKFL